MVAVQIASTRKEETERIKMLRTKLREKRASMSQSEQDTEVSKYDFFLK